MSNTNELLAEKAEERAEKSGGGVPAIDRALNVLECLSQSRKGYSVSEISRRLALPKSSVHLILRTLERRGYLQKQSAGGRYKFGMKLIALGRTALDGVELRDEARPALAALAQHTGLTVHMGVLERGEIVIIERLESASTIRVVSWIGRRMSVNSTAVGKALIAHLPGPEFDARVRPEQLARPNDRTIGSMADLRKELVRVRQRGYSVCDEEDEIGVRAVGAPILNRQGHSIAAISAAGTTQQIPPERVDELGQAVRDAAAEISARFQRASN
ncbi:MAG: IclR family transcriptional regulator [Vicinamibacteria bacterium]|nr:IclR family transcriptional regulator [Vicinamibacteria bacterium]